MVIIGGDSLEENFVLDDGENSVITTDCENSESDLADSLQVGIVRSNCSSDDTENEETTVAKKAKLNWREAAVASAGGMHSQKSILSAAMVAMSKYFPNADAVFSSSGVDELSFVDCSSFCASGNTSVRNLLEYVNDKVGCLTEPTTPALRCLIIAGSGARAMYLVKELRDFDKALSPLPLFYHGGGRKKEQNRTHESVLSKSKSVVAVSLPSRLIDICQRDLIDFSKLDLILIDLKANEKGVNVLSQKDTMLDAITVIGKWVLPHARTVKIMLV